MKSTFKQKLARAFGGYSGRTPEFYSRRICQLVRHCNGLAPEKMKQWHIDEFLAWMVRPGKYSRSSINQARSAIKIYFEYIGNPVHVEFFSTRNSLQIPDTLSRNEIQRLFDELPPLYRLIASDIYISLSASQDVLKKYPSRGSVVHRHTVNQKLKAAAKVANIAKPASIRVIRNSGIMHALQDTNDPAGVARRAGLKKSTIVRYLRLMEIKPD